MTFGTPIALLGLVAIPILVVLLVVGERRRQRGAATFGTPSLIAASMPRTRRWRRILPFALALTALAALIVGVARPRAVVPVPARQATVVLALDTSRSMAATDVRPSRLAAAITAAKAFLDAAPSSYSIGIVAFSTKAAVLIPPTTDRDQARNALNEIRLGAGTSLGDAIDVSVGVARPASGAATGPAKSAIPATVILLSDGEQTAGERQPLAAAASARKLGVPVNTVALGTRDAVVEVRLPGGVKERVTVTPDKKTLRAIAAKTGGRFVAAPTAEKLKQVYRDLGSKLGSKREKREVTAAFAGFGVVLLVLASGLSLAWTRRPL